MEVDTFNEWTKKNNRWQKMSQLYNKVITEGEWMDIKTFHYIFLPFSLWMLGGKKSYRLYIYFCIYLLCNKLWK